MSSKGDEGSFVLAEVSHEATSCSMNVCSVIDQFDFSLMPSREVNLLHIVNLALEAMMISRWYPTVSISNNSIVY
jgi:hypothetical protein